MNSTVTYVLGGLQAVFGLLALIFGWTTTDVALGLITTGASILGITAQNVKLGKTLGKAI